MFTIFLIFCNPQITKKIWYGRCAPIFFFLSPFSRLFGGIAHIERKWIIKRWIIMDYFTHTLHHLHPAKNHYDSIGLSSFKTQNSQLISARHFRLLIYDYTLTIYPFSLYPSILALAERTTPSTEKEEGREGERANDIGHSTMSLAK